MAYRIILRRDSSTNWEASNTVLMAGEPGYETDTGKLKIGDGISAWETLEYISGPTGATGPSGGIGTGANTFYGDQYISGPTGTIILLGYSTLDYPDDTSAASGGIPLGGIYHTSGLIKIRLT